MIPLLVLGCAISKKKIRQIQYETLKFSLKISSITGDMRFDIKTSNRNVKQFDDYKAFLC